MEWNENRTVEAEIITITDVSKQRKKKSSGGKKYIALACALSVMAGSGFGIVYSNHPATVTAQVPIKQTATQTAYLNLPVEVQVPIVSTTTDEITLLSNTATISAANNSVVQVVKNAANSVVSISTVSTLRTRYNQILESESAGSGIIYKEDAEKVYIVTNNHVISDASKVWVSLDDDNQVAASYVGSDARTDLAVISVNKAELLASGSSDYKVAAFGDSESMEVGESVVAIGNALGEGKTATLGIISAKNKKINIDGREIKVLQTDAAINPGNSGGALVNARSQVIGINTAKLSETAVEGMGYSIPVSEAKPIIEELIINGSIQRPVLEIQALAITEEIKQLNNLETDGVVVMSINAGSAVEKAGLEKWDIIVAYNDTKITSVQQLSQMVSESKVGETVKLSILRDRTQPIIIEVTLQSSSSSSPKF